MTLWFAKRNENSLPSGVTNVAYSLLLPCLSATRAVAKSPIKVCSGFCDIFSIFSANESSFFCIFAPSALETTVLRCCWLSAMEAVWGAVFLLPFSELSRFFRTFAPDSASETTVTYAFSPSGELSFAVSDVVFILPLPPISRANSLNLSSVRCPSLLLATTSSPDDRISLTNPSRNAFVTLPTPLPSSPFCCCTVSTTLPLSTNTILRPALIRIGKYCST